MYAKLRNDHESVKRSTIKPANFFPRTEPNLFSISSMANMMDARDTIGQGRWNMRERGWKNNLKMIYRRKMDMIFAFIDDMQGGKKGKNLRR
ncbi:E3 ubiquitin-protein ligase [Canna indica]|uniref:E3 ubiquitin-protein ligase n=1 Tax=Canna indica TaxID=4628 RepID=A0AAQ3QFJ1_9LILI|nr:E3 ubiquitin-protein ligase [Canna indica]